MAQTILLVEDYDDSREYLRIWLEALGFQVVEAINGREAIQFARQIYPDLILMDICMPVLDGISATVSIRKLEKGKNVPVIAISADRKWYHEEALQAGCNEVVDKPIDHANLEIMINRYLPASIGL
jgi:CheY-like chemotaxis protein